MPLPKKTILQATADFNIVPPKEKASLTVVADDKVDNTKKDINRNISVNNLWFCCFIKCSMLETKDHVFCFISQLSIRSCI